MMIDRIVKSSLSKISPVLISSFQLASVEKKEKEKKTLSPHTYTHSAIEQTPRSFFVAMLTT